MPATFLQLLFARDPRKLATFPSVSLDQALTAWREFAEASSVEPAAPANAPASSDTDLDAPLADLATHVWRARYRLRDNAQPVDTLRRTSRHIDSAVETFRLLDLDLKDWVNEPYDPGLPVKVLTFQPTENLTRDTIIEVIRPAVLWRNRLLQSGEVVVGTPLKKSAG